MAVISDLPEELLEKICVLTSFPLDPYFIFYGRSFLQPLSTWHRNSVSSLSMVNAHLRRLCLPILFCHVQSWVTCAPEPHQEVAKFRDRMLCVPASFRASVTRLDIFPYKFSRSPSTERIVQDIIRALPSLTHLSVKLIGPSYMQNCLIDYWLLSAINEHASLVNVAITCTAEDIRMLPSLSLARLIVCNRLTIEEKESSDDPFTISLEALEACLSRGLRIKNTFPFRPSCLLSYVKGPVFTGLRSLNLCIDNRDPFDEHSMHAFTRFCLTHESLRSLNFYRPVCASNTLQQPGSDALQHLLPCSDFLLELCENAQLYGTTNSFGVREVSVRRAATVVPDNGNSLFAGWTVFSITIVPVTRALTVIQCLAQTFPGLRQLMLELGEIADRTTNKFSPDTFINTIVDSFPLLELLESRYLHSQLDLENCNASEYLSSDVLHSPPHELLKAIYLQIAGRLPYMHAGYAQYRAANNTSIRSYHFQHTLPRDEQRVRCTGGRELGDPFDEYH